MDERDEFPARIDKRFDHVEAELRAIGDRIERMRIALIRGTMAMCIGILGSNAALAALIIART